MARTLGYKVVDVFTSNPLEGNPVAVVFDADGLDTAQMQSIAGWTNLSETTFVLPPTCPTADYRLRIFTPRSELPFAGHPTLGSAYAILENRQDDVPHRRLVQECAQGLVQVTSTHSDGNRIMRLTLPEATVQTLTPPDVVDLERIIGCELADQPTPAVIDVGAVWVVVRLDSAASVLAIRPDLTRLAAFERRLGLTGLTVFGPRDQPDDAAIEVRTFAPSCGVDEDPVCGSGNGSVALFQRERGLLGPQGSTYIATQGQLVGRHGRIHVSVAPAGDVEVGGFCVTTVTGTLTLNLSPRPPIAPHDWGQ